MPTFHDGFKLITKHGNDSDIVISRLRKSKEDADKQLEQLGVNCGQIWVERHAEYYEFERLCRYEPPFDYSACEGSGCRDVATRAIGGNDISNRDIDDFWEIAAGDDIDKIVHATFIHGFLDGVYKAYESLADEV